MAVCTGSSHHHDYSISNTLDLGMLQRKETCSSVLHSQSGLLSCLHLSLISSEAEYRAASV